MEQQKIKISEELKLQLDELYSRKMALNDVEQNHILAMAKLQMELSRNLNKVWDKVVAEIGDEENKFDCDYLTKEGVVVRR